jgi:hypothetical protein
LLLMRRIFPSGFFFSGRPKRREKLRLSASRATRARSTAQRRGARGGGKG